MPISFIFNFRKEVYIQINSFLPNLFMEELMAA